MRLSQLDRGCLFRINGNPWSLFMKINLHDYSCVCIESDEDEEGMVFDFDKDNDPEVYLKSPHEDNDE